MGIHGLTKFIQEKAPSAVRYVEPKTFMGRTLAIDVSLALYQFMVSIRDAEHFGSFTNEAGEQTSHLMGMVNRMTRLMELGAKPVAVFDGAAPTLKGGELAKRRDRKSAADVAFADAQERGDAEDIKKFAGRTVRVTREHNESVKHLMRLMGIPVVEAPSEAEAQCADLCRKGRVYATATEDADALCFGTPLLIRHLTFGDSKTGPNGKSSQVLEISLPKLLEALEMDHSTFVDFCILCGCDYCDTIKGVGPSTAFKLIKQHKSIEGVLSNLADKKNIPLVYPYKEAREFFMQPLVLPDDNIPSLDPKEADESGLIHYLVNDNNFNLGRVTAVLARLKKARSTAAQCRLDSFFGAPRISTSSSLPVKKEIQKAKPKPKAKSGPPKK